MIPRPSSASIATMTELILPTHANALGGVFGGQILAWVDLCAAICARRHTSSTVVTAGFDDVSFERPILVGQVAELKARVTAAFKTSVEVLVEVHGEDAIHGERWHCLTAFVTFVAVDAKLAPVSVPPLLVETDEDKVLAEEARERRDHRLKRRRSGKA